MAKIFISYSSKDLEFAYKLFHALRENGLNVWFDKESIRGGIDWSDSIQEGLQESDLMILLLSPDSIASKNVADEWKYFHTNNKTIIPILISQVSIEKIHFQLQRKQYIDFHKLDFDIVLEKLIKELNYYGVESNTQKIQVPLKILVLGEFKIGKSLLINAIIGEHILPTSLEFTRTNTRIKYGELNAYTTKKKIKSWDELRGVIQSELNNDTELNNDMLNDLEELVTVTANSDFLLKNNIEFMETYGQGEFYTNFSKLYDEYDIIIFCVSAIKFISLRERELIEEILELGFRNKLVIAITRFDMLSQEEISKLKHYATQFLEKYLIKNFYFISGINALTGLSKNDSKLYEESGIQTLINKILEFRKEQK